MEWLALDFTKGEVGWFCFVDLELQVFRRYRVSNIVFFFFFFKWFWAKQKYHPNSGPRKNEENSEAEKTLKLKKCRIYLF